MEPISASEALARSNGEKTKSATGADADDINYSLTLSRLYETLRQESDNKKKKIAFIAPRFVLDGCLADPVLLAKQLKATLMTLEYAVEREGDTLFISWDKEDTKKRERPLSLIRGRAIPPSNNTSGPPRTSVRLAPTTGQAVFAKKKIKKKN